MCVFFSASSCRDYADYHLRLLLLIRCVSAVALMEVAGAPCAEKRREKKLGQTFLGKTFSLPHCSPLLSDSSLFSLLSSLFSLSSLCLFSLSLAIPLRTLLGCLCGGMSLCRWGRDGSLFQTDPAARRDSQRATQSGPRLVRICQTCSRDCATDSTPGPVPHRFVSLFLHISPFFVICFCHTHPNDFPLVSP